MSTITKAFSLLPLKYFIPLFVAVGLIVGVLTPIGQKYFDNNWNTLVNSGAVWLLVAFAVGTFAPNKMWAIVAGLGTLFGAVIGYFLMVPIMTGYDIAFIGMAYWLVIAVVGGPLFGLAGYWWRTGSQRWHVIATGMLGSVFVAEGVLGLMTQQQDKMISRWVEVVVGLIIPLLLGRTMKNKLLALAVMPVVMLLAFAAYWAIDWASMWAFSR